MLAIFKKDLRSLFLSPTAYVILCIYSFLTAVMFYLTTFFNQSSDLSGMFYFSSVFSIITVTILSMKFFAEERKTKTDQVLLTAPVNLTGIVLGKFLAGMFVYMLTMFITLIYVMVISFFGNLDWGIVLTNYVGMILLGMALIAIAEFFSSLTQSQIAAFMFTLVSLALILLSSILINIIKNYMMTWPDFLSTLINSFFNVIMVFDRFVNFAYGILDLSTIIYYLSISVLFLFLTTRVLEKRRWS